MSNKAPAIRFKGFTHAWEQRKLGEVVEKLKSYSLSRDVEIKEATGYRYIHYGDIHKQVADIVTEDQQLPRIKAGDYESLEQGDLILADASEDYTGIAEPCVILHKPKERIIAGLHTIAVRPQNINPLYLYYLFHTEKFKKFGNHVGTGLKVFGITFNNLSLFETKLPTLAEQTAIGNFFRTLDDAITLYKRKLDGLKELKKGYLQQMFPQAGERVPRVRFAGFEGDWEVRKLGEVAEFNPRSVLPNIFEYVDLESVVGTSLISHRTENKNEAPSRAQRLAKRNDVFFQTVRPYQKHNYHFDLPFDNYVFSTGYAQLRPSVDSYFLFCQMQDEIFVAKVLDRCTGTSYPAINSTDLAEIEVCKAPEKAEQTAIGNFFRNLDEQITTQQTKLEKLKQLKSAYLQKMFV